MRCGSIFLAAAACVTLLGGCGGGGSSNPVSGKVTLDGAPLVGARVMLYPKERSAPGMENAPFIGKTDGDGQFSVGPLGKPGEGAAVGEYTLTISTGYTEDSTEGAPVPPEKVRPPHSTTGVDFTVPDGGATDANFDLTSK